MQNHHICMEVSMDSETAVNVLKGVLVGSMVAIEFRGGSDEFDSADRFLTWHKMGIINLPRYEKTGLSRALVNEWGPSETRTFCFMVLRKFPVREFPEELFPQIKHLEVIRF